MSKNFTSVLKLVTAVEGESEKGIATQVNSASGDSNLLQVENRTVTLPTVQPLPLSPSRSTQLQEIRFNFDRVFSSSEAQNSIYKQSVKEIVESCLLGYHGTVISFGTADGRKENRLKEDVVCKAAEQIFRCIKKSRRSKLRSSTFNLVVLCSYVIVINEKVRDLLFGYPADTAARQTGGEGDTVDIELPPELQLVNGSFSSVPQHEVKSGNVASFLQFGREMERRIFEVHQLERMGRVSSTPQGMHQVTEKAHHTVFSLTVEYSQFGTVNAPVSGNLMFVDIAPSDPLANRQQYTTGDQLAPAIVSLFTFADVISSLTSNAAVIEGIRSTGSAYNQDEEATQLPCVPETTSKQISQNSVLTQLLQESLGGNCKTLLITYVPELVPPNRYGEMYETLKIASRARMIHNTPNKRDLAEKALMSAYMRGLQEMYGLGVQAKQGQQTPQRARIVLTSVTPFQHQTDTGLESKRSLSGSKDSITSGDINTAYDEMINITEGEERYGNHIMVISYHSYCC